MTKTVTTNAVADPSQYFSLVVTFSEGVFNWQVISRRSDGQTGNVVRNSIYGLSVNIGGNSVYIGDLDWRDYQVGVALRAGSVPLSSCVVNNGAVSISVSGNYNHGTWDSSYRCYGSDTITIVSPTVTLDPNYTLTDDYQGQIVGGITQITFSMSAVVGTVGNTIDSYRLYLDGVQVYNGTSSTGTITALTSAGTHTVYAVAVESNGATGQSSSVSITTVGYTAPSFTKVSSVRWSTSDDTGQSADDGTHAKLTPVYVQSKVGSTSIPTYCRVTITGTSYTGIVSTSGGSLYTGAILLDTQSYTVTYTLYDDFSSVTVVRTDTISIGGRGLDMIHDATDGYGVAFGMKATAGRNDSAYPIRVVELDSSGTILKSSEMGSTPTLATQSLVTRTSGLTINTQSLYIYGRVAFLTLYLRADGATHSGNIFEGSISDYLPINNVMNASYFSQTAIGCSLRADGVLTVRALGSVYLDSGNVVVTFTYMF